jgi:MFS family permease
MNAEGSTATVSADASRSVAAPGARLALTLLLLINLFNYIDRQVLSAVVPKIKQEFFPDSSKKVERQSGEASGREPEAAEATKEDPWVKTKIGTLTTAFIVSYMLFAPVFGVLADRMSRWWLIGIGVIVWTIASGASGLATAFLMLLLTRIFVGVGEAAYGPAAPAVISDMYPVSRRGYVMAWFYAAIPVGSALGFVLGGQMLNVSHWFTGVENWRWGFYAVVPPGMLLAVFCFFMREPARGHSDAIDARTLPRGPDVGEPSGVDPHAERAHGPAVPGADARGSGETSQPALSEPHHATWADYKIILQTPSFVYATVGYTALTFVLGGVAAWMPTYVSDSRGQANEAQAATVFGAIVVVAGLLSTLLGGWAGDRLRGRFPGSYLLVSGWGVLFSFPLMLGVIFVDFPYAWGFVFLSVFWMFFNTGPINTVLANVTHPSVRASAFALNILAIHLLGDAISPPIMGGLADFGAKLASGGTLTGWAAEALGRHDGMDFSMGCTSLLLLVAGLVWLRGARFLERDTALAPLRVAHRPVADANRNPVTIRNGAVTESTPPLSPPAESGRG